MYLPDMETKFSRPTRNYDYGDEHQNGLSVFSMKARPFGHVKALLSEEQLTKARCYILSNCDEVEPYIKMQKAELQGISIEDVGDSTDFDETQHKQFPKWFKDGVLGDETSSGCEEMSFPGDTDRGIIWGIEYLTGCFIPLQMYIFN